MRIKRTRVEYKEPMTALKNQKAIQQDKLMNYGERKLVNIRVILTSTNLLMLEEI